TLNGTKGRCIFVQRPVRSDVVVITSIGSQDPAQMWFTPNNEMIETLAPDRSDQPFSEAILPRRSRCDGLVPDAHGTPFEAGFRPSAKPGFLLQRSIFAYCLGQKRTLPPLKTYCA